MNRCSPNCPTQDHETWGACQRAKNLHLGVDQTKANYRVSNRYWTEIKEYREARAQGIQPRSTNLNDIRSAVNASKRNDLAIQDI